MLGSDSGVGHVSGVGNQNFSYSGGGFCSDPNDGLIFFEIISLIPSSTLSGWFIFANAKIGGSICIRFSYSVSVSIENFPILVLKGIAKLCSVMLNAVT